MYNEYLKGFFTMSCELIKNLQFHKPIIALNDMLLILLTLASLISLIIIFICILISNVIRTSDFLGHYLFGAKKINQNKDNV